MLRRVAALLGFLVIAALTLGIVFILGMRAKSPPVLSAVRRVNRTVFNPRQMESAGTPGSYASVVHHVGRSTGNAYETPVGAVPTESGFVIALPYGSHSDWLKNVLASGRATLVTEGDTYEVDQPLVVPIEVAESYFSPEDKRAQRLFGVDEGLMLRRIDSAPA